MIRFTEREKLPKRIVIGYKGKKYPLYECTAFIDDDDSKQIIIFGTDSLADEIIDKEMGEGKDMECRYIDNSIYGYIPDNIKRGDIKRYIEENFD